MQREASVPPDVGTLRRCRLHRNHEQAASNMYANRMHSWEAVGPDCGEVAEPTGQPTPHVLGQFTVTRLELCPVHSIQDGQACAMRTRLPEGSRNAQSRTPQGWDTGSWSTSAPDAVAGGRRFPLASLRRRYPSGRLVRCGSRRRRLEAPIVRDLRRSISHLELYRHVRRLDHGGRHHAGHEPHIVHRLTANESNDTEWSRLYFNLRHDLVLYHFGHNASEVITHRRAGCYERIGVLVERLSELSERTPVDSASPRH